MAEQYEHYYAVIMAGGGGTRLWPISRKAHPKQVMKLDRERTLFQIAVDRLEGLFQPEQIFVVTVQEQADQLKKICPQIPEENFLIEPFPKGTASVVGLAAAVLGHRDANATMAVLTADHFIYNVSQFQNVLKSAYELSQEDWMVTLGIEPSYPSTGYGYIQRGEKIGNYDGMEVYTVKRFTEKPPARIAEEYVSGGQHFWNSGMFIWRTEAISGEIARQMPDLSSILNDIRDLLSEPEWNIKITDLWGKIHSQTIDYGIMEHAEKVAVIPASDLGWSDVGAWSSLYDVVEPDNDGNIIRHPDHIGLDTKNTIVFSNNSDRLIVSIGVEDLIIVEDEDVLLVCSREKAQDVREVVKRLRSENRENYL